MDELDLLRKFHASIPRPSASETAEARARLLTAIGHPGSGAPGRLAVPGRLAALGRRLARPRLWAPLAAAGIVTALAVTAATIAPFGHGNSGSTPRPGTLTAASVLGRAAAAAARQPSGSGRYDVTEDENYFGLPQSLSLEITWYGNGVPGYLWFQGTSGKPGEMALTSTDNEIGFGYTYLTWAQLSRLPTAPGQLLADIAQASRHGAPPTTNREFMTISGLLELGNIVPPSLRSALFKVAARLPGLIVRPDVQDLIGRAAIEIYLPGRNVYNPPFALLLDSRTSAVLGTAIFDHPDNPALRCGNNAETAVLSSGYVNAIGRLPAGAPHQARPVSRHTIIPSCSPTQRPSPSLTQTRSPSP
jgi:hypothetical protein